MCPHKFAEVDSKTIYAVGLIGGTPPPHGADTVGRGDYPRV